MAYHLDGTVAWYNDNHGGNGSWASAPVSKTYMSEAQKSVLNNEAENNLFTIDRRVTNPSITAYVGVVFPEPRDVVGWHIHLHADALENGAELRGFEWSDDSSNSIDGTWNTIIGSQSTDYAFTQDNSYRYRIAIEAISAPACRSMRFMVRDNDTGTASAALTAFHVYGSISAGETPDRVVFIDNSTGLEFTGVHDWGDVPRGTTLDKEIKIKNNSATLSASDIDLAFGALTGSSNTWHTLSDSGAAFGSTLNIAGPIAAGASYPAADTITLRLTVAANEGLSLQSAYLSALVNTWA